MTSTVTRIYLDYQASTPLDRRVLEAMIPYFIEQPGNPHAADHAFGWAARAAIDSALDDIASTIGADPDEVIFTSGATEANNLAILGLAARATDRSRILVSAIEHKCVLAAAEAARRYGFSVERIGVDSEGHLDLDALRRSLSEDVLLVSVMSVNNEVGTIQPLEIIGELAHRAGALFHTDASQVLTTMDFDVESNDVDLASFSGHKIYGPKGIGALYVRRDMQRLLEPMIVGGGQQNGLRSGTLPVPLCVGLGHAVGVYRNKEEGKAERERVRLLRDTLVRGLLSLLPSAKLNGPPLHNRHCANANIRFHDLDAKDLLGILQPKIGASTGSACTSGVEEPSHVLKSLGMTDLEANASIRFSAGRFTTDLEINEALSAIREAVATGCY